jgi:hypothetical protein
MAKKSTSKAKLDQGEALTPQQQGQIADSKRATETEKLRNLASKFLVGTRVSRSVWVKDAANPLLLVKGYKSGRVMFNIVCPNSGYPTLLVLWDGDKTPVPEHPPNLTIEDW